MCNIEQEKENLSKKKNPFGISDVITYWLDEQADRIGECIGAIELEGRGITNVMNQELTEKLSGKKVEVITCANNGCFDGTVLQDKKLTIEEVNILGNSDTVVFAFNDGDHGEVSTLSFRDAYNLIHYGSTNVYSFLSYTFIQFITEDEEEETAKKGTEDLQDNKPEEGMVREFSEAPQAVVESLNEDGKEEYVTFRGNLVGKAMELRQSLAFGHKKHSADLSSRAKLEDTVNLMLSWSHKDQLAGEYIQATLRLESMKKVLSAIENGEKTRFESPKSLIEEHIRCLENYLTILDAICVIEEVNS